MFKWLFGEMTSNTRITKTLISRNPLIITGSQGAGKTTLAVSLVTAYLQQNEGAQFFHHGLDGATFGEAFDDPTQWHKLPDNSIIYIDEADKNGFASTKRAEPLEKLPDYIRAITELRHKGHYLILSTVSVMDIRHFVREKSQGWADLSRPFGLKYALCTIYPGWRNTNGLNKHDKRLWDNQRLRLKFFHDQKAQGKFKSSSVHTSTYTAKNLPWGMLFLFLALIVIAVWFGLKGVYRVTTSQVPVEETPIQPREAPQPTPQPLLSSQQSTPPQSTPYSLTPLQRLTYNVPHFMTDEDYYVFSALGGYTCGRAQFGEIRYCRCYALDTGKRIFSVSFKTCAAHVNTRAYPILKLEASS